MRARLFQHQAVGCCVVVKDDPSHLLKGRKDGEGGRAKLPAQTGVATARSAVCCTRTAAAAAARTTSMHGGSSALCSPGTDRHGQSDAMHRMRPMQRARRQLLRATLLPPVCCCCPCRIRAAPHLVKNGPECDLGPDHPLAISNSGRGPGLPLLAHFKGQPARVEGTVPSCVIYIINLRGSPSCDEGELWWILGWASWLCVIWVKLRWYRGLFGRKMRR